MSSFSSACASQNSETVLNTTSNVISTVKWGIKKFSKIIKNSGEFIVSPLFYTSGNAHEWIIHLYPNNRVGVYDPKYDCHIYVEYISLFLVNLNNLDVTTQATFSILKKGEKKCHSQKLIHNFKSQSKVGWEVFVRRELLLGGSGFLPNDTLTVVCEIQVLGYSDQLCSHSTHSDLEKLSEDLKQQYVNSVHNFSDLTISVGDKTFYVHKFILAARSPVFAAMFEHQMLESRSNKVHISDIEPRVMEELLLFMYSAQCPGISEMAAELLQASDKYDIDGLKQLAERSLFKQLTMENAVKTLIVSYLYNCKSLEQKTLSFINKHKEHLNTSEWTAMLIAYPDLGQKSLKEVGPQHIAT